MPLYEVGIVGALITGVNQTPLIKITGNETLSKVYADLKSTNPPTGQSVIFDINKNGTSIWAGAQVNRLSVSAGAVAGNQSTFDNPATLVEGDLLTVDVDQVGSGDPGSDATITIKTV